MSTLTLSCNEAFHICDKNQYHEAFLWEKVKLAFHLIYCSVCRKYTARNNKLTRAVKSPKVHTISNAEKESLRERLNKELAE